MSKIKQAVQVVLSIRSRGYGSILNRWYHYAQL